MRRDHADNEKVYVTNMVSGTVSVINASDVRGRQEHHGRDRAIRLRADARRQQALRRQLLVGQRLGDQHGHRHGHARPSRARRRTKPRAIAVATDGKVYVTSFLAHLARRGRTVEQKEGRDDGKEGRVTVISSATDKVLGTVVLEPVANTGFNSNGSVLDRIPATDPPTFTFTTGAFPNLLQGIAIKGGQAYLPNVGSSPNGPFRFNVNVQGLLSVIDTATDVDAGLTLNMNRGVQFENVGQKLFNTTPIAIAFKHGANEGFVVLGGIDRLVRVVLAARRRADASTRRPRCCPRARSSDIIRIPVRQESAGDRDQLDRHARLRDELHLARCVGRGHLRQRPEAVPRRSSGSRRRACRTPGTLAAIIQRGQRAVQHQHRAGGHAGHVDAARGPDVGHRLGQLLQLPSRRPAPTA